ncbi:helix-turn-helix domain-containing protein [Solibacillus isronensis]|uniref:helix-turn-helix domain-containing protein n=1 Tax=Solibacillus isronensis TaxID=412383 RepID=UPI0039A12310
MESNTVIGFGEFIRNRRKELNMSQKELAEKTDRLQSAISQYEHEKHFPVGPEEYFKLASALKVSVTELMEMVNRSKRKTVDEHEAFLIDLETLKKDELKQRYKFVFRGEEVSIDEIKETLDFIKYKRSLDQ